MIGLTVDIAERLRQQAQTQTQFALIGTVADLAALADMPRVMPALYVVPLAESAEAPDTIGATSQQLHTAVFGLQYVVRHAGDASGAKATEALAALRETVQAALVGWRPPGCIDYLQFQRGELVDLMDGGVIAWRDDFAVSKTVQRANALT